MKREFIKEYKTLHAARIAAAQFRKHGARRANVFVKRVTDKRRRVDSTPAVYVLR